MLPSIKISVSLVLLGMSAHVMATYNKVGNDGGALADKAVLGQSASDWACTYDSNSKLIWEIKTSDGSLRDKHASYTWYNSDIATNGGNAGTPNGGSCGNKTSCDTEKYVQYVNRQKLCGASDWRLPTIDELKQLSNVNYQPAIDPVFFPDVSNSTTTLAVPITGFWSSSYATATTAPLTLSPTATLNSAIRVPVAKAVANTVSKAWYYAYENANSVYEAKGIAHLVRLVRDGQNFIPLATPAPTPTPTPSATTTPAGEIWREEFTNVTNSGSAQGINYQQTPTSQGAIFSRANESRVQYPFSSGLPKSGTLEFRLKIDVAYSYNNGQLSSTDNCATLFNTSAPGDQIWAGSTSFQACKNGDISITTSTVFSNDGPIQTLTAKNTAFRFGEWHVLSFSYGSQGQAIAVDAKEVASNRANTQFMGAGGTQKEAIDIPTLGEAVSSMQQNNLFDAGFEGVVDTMRASGKAKDWFLGNDLPKPTSRLAPGSFSEPNNSATLATRVFANDVPQQHLFDNTNDEDWFEFYAQPGERLTIDIPDASVGAAVAPAMKLFDAHGNLLNAGVSGILGRGQQLNFTATGTGTQLQLYRIQVSNSHAASCPASPGVPVLDKKLFAKTGSEDACSNNDPTANSYKLRIFDTDAPQKSVVSGTIQSICNNNGIANAFAFATIATGNPDEYAGQTLADPQGYYAIRLNPDNYTLNSQPDTFQPLNQTLIVAQDDAQSINFKHTPLATCAGAVNPAIDPSVKKQNAVAVYDHDQRLLIVRDVTAGGKVFYAELVGVGPFEQLRFQLYRVYEISSSFHTQPGSYDFNTLIVDLPTVFAFDKLFKIQMQNDGNWVFTVLFNNIQELP